MKLTQFTVCCFYMELETHPFEPFVPAGAKVLVMGTFPPQPKRWAMEFYYPNRTNDFWKVMGLLFRDDRFAFYNPHTKEYDIAAITDLLDEKGIALSDTGHKVRRLKNNASDKFLEIIEPVDLATLALKMPQLKAIATTGEKAARTLSEITGTEMPAMGGFVPYADGLTIWRMPSTSRAYPLALELKAGFYRKLFEFTGIL